MTQILQCTPSYTPPNSSYKYSTRLMPGNRECHGSTLTLFAFKRNLLRRVVQLSNFMAFPRTSKWSKSSCPTSTHNICFLQEIRKIYISRSGHSSYLELWSPCPGTSKLTQSRSMSSHIRKHWSVFALRIESQKWVKTHKWIKIYFFTSPVWNQVYIFYFLSVQ